MLRVDGFVSGPDRASSGVNVVELDDRDTLSCPSFAGGEVIEFRDVADREASFRRSTSSGCAAATAPLQPKMRLGDRPVIEAVHSHDDILEFRGDKDTAFAHPIGSTLVLNFAELHTKCGTECANCPCEFDRAGGEMDALDVQAMLMREGLDLADVGRVRARFLRKLLARQVFAFARLLCAER